MPKTHVDISLIEDLQRKGHNFTAAYLFHYMQDEVQKGNTVLLVRPTAIGTIEEEFTDVDPIKDYFSTFITKFP
jgi:hypothetical protein